MRLPRAITDNKALEPSALRARFRVALEPTRPGRSRVDERPMAFTPATRRGTLSGWRWALAGGIAAALAIAAVGVLA